MNFSKILFFTILCFTVGLLFSCHPDSPVVEEPEMEDSTHVENPPVGNLHGDPAGNYQGYYRCDGVSGSLPLHFGVDTSLGSLILIALGPDTIGIGDAHGCLLSNTFFKFDSTTSAGYEVWGGILTGGYSKLYYYPDSVWLFTPFHFSYGWLNHQFNGKKQ